MKTPANAYRPWVDPPVAKAAVPRPCDRCKHFQPGAINPAAGMGDCAIKQVPVYPGADLHCHEWVKA